MASAEVKRILLESSQTIEAAAAALASHRPGDSENSEKEGSEAPARAKARLAQAVNEVKLEVSKCAVMGASVRDDPSVAEPLLDALQQKAIILCALLSELQTRGGQLLSSQLHTLAKGLMDAVGMFIATLGEDAGSSDGLNRSAGVVFQRCQAMRNAPLSEKAAIGRGILQVAAQLKDVVREANELHEENAAAQRAGGAGTSGHDGNGSALSDGVDASSKGARGAEVEQEEAEDDLGFEAAPATPQEAAVISAGLECLQQLLAFLESLLRVLQGAKVQGDEDEGWAVVLSNLRQLAYPINDLGASLYPPQDQTELRDVLHSLMTGCSKTKDSLALLGGSTDYFQGVDAACTDLQAAIERLD